MRIAMALVICCALAGEAAAAPTPLKAHRIGSAPSLPKADGTRFAAWPTTDFERTAVYDVRTGVVDEVAPPPGVCVNSAIGAAALVYTCDGAFGIGTARLLDLRIRRTRQVVGDAPAFYGQSPGRSFVAVGTRWIQANMTDYHISVSAFYSRATGERYAGPSPFGRHVRPDLDRASLRAKICSPLSARRNPSDASEVSDPYQPPLIDGRFALDIIREGTEGETRLVLRHCGTKRHRTICRGFCFSPVLDRGQALWADDVGVLHVLGVRAARARSYVVRGHPIATVDPLGDRLLLGTDRLFGEPRVQLRVTRRPGAARAPRRP